MSLPRIPHMIVGSIETSELLGVLIVHCVFTSLDMVVMLFFYCLILIYKFLELIDDEFL